MSRASRIAFERVEPNDPSLAVEGLCDFFPQDDDRTGEKLAIGWLDDLFDAASEIGAAAAKQSPIALDAALDVNDLADFFPAADKPCSNFDVGDDLWEPC